jgi:hypothetical protein
VHQLSDGECLVWDESVVSGVRCVRGAGSLGVDDAQRSEV